MGRPCNTPDHRVCNLPQGYKFVTRDDYAGACSGAGLECLHHDLDIARVDTAERFIGDEAGWFPRKGEGKFSPS